MKISTVGLVGALACSPEGTYCAAAVSEKIHVWEVSRPTVVMATSDLYQELMIRWPSTTMLGLITLPQLTILLCERPSCIRSLSTAL